MPRPAATAIQPLPPAHPTTPTTTSPATSDSWRPACGGFTWRAESSAPSGRAHAAMKTAGRRGGRGRHSRLVSLAGGERRLSLHHQPDESTVGVILNMISSSRIAAEYQEEEAPGAGSAAVPESSQDGLPTRRAVCRGPVQPGRLTATSGMWTLLTLASKALTWHQTNTESAATASPVAPKSATETLLNQSFTLRLLRSTKKLVGKEHEARDRGEQAKRRADEIAAEVHVRKRERVVQLRCHPQEQPEQQDGTYRTLFETQEDPARERPSNSCERLAADAADDDEADADRGQRSDK